jgi:hypothetical protein
MTARAQQLHATADRQIAELIDLLRTAEEATLRLPGAGREKLGDGTVAALLGHTADNYERIAVFLADRERMPASHAPPQHGIPSVLRTLRHRPTDHRTPLSGQHDSPYSADDLDVALLIQQLSGTRVALTAIEELTDTQLDAIPSKDSFRFCDGQRTLERVLAGLLTHQDRQLETLRAAVT